MGSSGICLNGDEWDRLYRDATHPNLDAINRRELFLNRTDLGDWVQEGETFVANLPSASYSQRKNLNNK